MQNILKHTATAISVLFSPLLVPTIAIVLALEFSELDAITASNKLLVTSIVLILTGLSPYMLIRAMIMLKMAGNTDLTDRRERTLPYLVTLCLYGVTLLYFYLSGAPWWLMAFMAGGIVALGADVIINRRWKISAHATSAGALTALAFSLTLRAADPHQLLIMLTAVTLCAGLTCTSRLILRRHTQAQVYAGFVVGAIAVGVLSAL